MRLTLAMYCIIIFPPNRADTTAFQAATAQRSIHSIQTITALCSLLQYKPATLVRVSEKFKSFL